MSEESQGRRRSIDRGGLIYTAPASLVGYAVMHPSSVPPPSPIYAFEAEEITELRLSERGADERTGVAVAATKTFPFRQMKCRCRRCRMPHALGWGLWVSFYLCDRIGFDSAH